MLRRLGRNKMSGIGRRPRRGRAASRLPTARLRLEVLEPRQLLDAGPLYITEFLADNAQNLADKDGDYTDWIEIYNPTTGTIALDGWYLTDESDELMQWQFPDTTAGVDVPLAAGAYVKVFASEKDYRLNGGIPVSEFHTNFKLDKDEGYLALVQPDGSTIASQYSYPRQLTDVSYGMPMPNSVVVDAGRVGQGARADGRLAGNHLDDDDLCRRRLDAGHDGRRLRVAPRDPAHRDRGQRFARRGQQRRVQLRRVQQR